MPATRLTRRICRRETRWWNSWPSETASSTLLPPSVRVQVLTSIPIKFKASTHENRSTVVCKVNFHWCLWGSDPKMGQVRSRYRARWYVQPLTFRPSYAGHRMAVSMSLGALPLNDSTACTLHAEQIFSTSLAAPTLCLLCSLGTVASDKFMFSIEKYSAAHPSPPSVEWGERAPRGCLVGIVHCKCLVNDVLLDLWAGLGAQAGGRVAGGFCYGGGGGGVALQWVITG